MATQTHYARGPWPEAAGYQALGNLMGGYPEMAIFRRFRNAGALDLLYRQADLQCTIHDWALTAEADQQTQGPGRRNDPLRHEYDRVFDELRRSVDADEPGARTQWRRWRQVSEKLKDYHERLLQFQKICSLPCVDEDHLEQLRRHLEEHDKGRGFLQGRERLIYEKPNERDMTSVASPNEPDVFTKLARGHIINFLHGVVGRNSHHMITVPKLANNESFRLWFRDYSPETAVRLARVLYAVLTSVLVTAAIVTLNRVKHVIGRIVLITVHNLAFTVATAVFAKARPGELFGVAAAYAAVLVVYASGPSGSSATPA